jgi:cytochrome c
MKNYKVIYPFLIMLASSLSGHAFAADCNAEKLSEVYGCNACHSVLPQKVDKSKRLPIGPSFLEIAQLFHREKTATSYQDLARIIKHGSSPYRSKFRGKISGLAMPPNDDTISDLDINRLLVWILSLEAK